MMSNAFRTTAKDIELVQPPPDSISKIAFSPTADILAVGSWDNGVRLYDVNSQGQSQPKAMYNHDAPVLDLTWAKSGTHIFSSGCDNVVKMYDVQTGQSQNIAGHDAPIKCVNYLDVPSGNGGRGMLATGGWDRKLKYWDLRQATPAMTLDMSDRVYAMDTAVNMLVVATGDRMIQVFDLNNPGQPMVRPNYESPLKWQTRVVSCFPTGDAFAVGSIEGRVAIQYPGQDEKKNFSFKCHRYDIATGSMQGTPAVSTSQNVFAVNTITFHPIQGTFCTGGSDGSLTFWDGIARTKLKGLTLKDMGNGDSTAKPPQWGTPVVSASFNHNQEIMAYALSYDWSKGHAGVPPAGATKVMLHPVTKEEVQKKDKLPGR